MKTCLKQFLNIFLIAAGLAMISASCTFEDNIEPEIDPEANTGLVTFSLKLPNNSTRSLTLADENELKEVKVLVFSESGVLKYATDAIYADLGDATIKKYTAKIAPTASGEKVDIMIVANANSLIRNKYPDGIPLNQGLTRDNLAQTFTVEKTSGWVSDKNNANYTPIPMWGWTTGATIHEENGLDANHSTIGLTRMMAKINLSILGEARNTFKLSAVYLMNRNTVGRIIPNITAQEPWTGLTPRALTPSLPTEPKTLKGAANGLMYGDSYLNNPAQPYEMNGVIYSFEANRGVGYSETNKTAYEESPCIIIGGRYEGDPATITYYRVDFSKKGSDGSQEYLHLLRNYFYDVSISNIDGPGYPSVDDALRNRPLHITGEVVPWIDSDMPIQVTDGIHVLSVDKDNISFDASGAPDSMKIYTDVSNGWRINVANIPSWLHIVSPTLTGDTLRGAPLEYIKVLFKLDALSKSSPPRETSFVVEAGALKKTITIRQSNDVKISLSLTPNTLIFPLSAPNSKSITVTSTPANAVRYVSYTKSGSISFLPGKGPSDYNNTAATDFVIQPTPGTSGSAMVLVRISNDEGQSVTQMFYIVQLATDTEFGFIGLPAAGYEADDQGPKTIQIISEIPWRLTMGQQNPPNTPYQGNMITLTDFAEHSAHPGMLEDYTFTLAQNPGYMPQRVAYFTVNSSAPGWSPFEFPVFQKGTQPEIEVLSPVTKLFEFYDNNTVTLTIKTNAGWRYTTDQNFSSVIAAVDSLPNVTHFGSNNGINMVTRTITFTPVDLSDIPGGQKKSTILRFETANHPGVEPAIEQVILTQGAKELWDDVFYSYDKDEELLTITAYTNTEWRIVCQNIIDSIVPAKPYGPQVVTVPVPWLGTFEAGNYNFSAWMASDVTKKKDTLISTPAATLNFVRYEGNLLRDTIPAEGIQMETSSSYLIFDGSYTGDFNIRVKRYEPLPVESGTIIPGDKLIRKIAIKPTNQWGIRKLGFEFQKGNEYIPIGDATTNRFVQKGYYISGRTQADALPPIMTSLNQFITGYYPTVYIYAAYNYTDGTGVGTTDSTRVTAGTAAAPIITIPANNSWEKDRNVSFIAEDRSVFPPHKETLSSVTQNHYSLTPAESPALIVPSAGSPEITFVFRGYHPAMQAFPSSNSIIAKNEYTNPGGDVTVSVSVKENFGKERTLWVDLREVGSPITRAKLVITQMGIPTNIILRGDNQDYWTTIQENYLDRYRSILPLAAEINMTALELKSLLESNGHQVAQGQEYDFFDKKPNGQTEYDKLAYIGGEWTLTPHIESGASIPTRFFVLLQAKD
ncbi:MAG: hypothetical protein LBH04_09525 [Tannerellaceae bacterium]|jgi:hypothetical protein|nr:hypothetical protein [Tannerellaceae bacterium]